MKLLALDPGTRRLGVALFDIDIAAETFALLEATAELADKWKRPEDVAHWQQEAMIGVTYVAVERPGAHPFKSGIAAAKLYERLGLHIGIASGLDYRVRVVDDGDVKTALANHATAHKYEVHTALAYLGYRLPRRAKEKCQACAVLNMDPNHSADAADAIAVGHVACSALIMERREIAS